MRALAQYNLLKTSGSFGTLGRIMGYLWRYWYLAALAVVVNLVQSYFEAMLPIIMIRNIVDVVLVDEQYVLLPYFMGCVLIIYAALSSLSFLGRYVQSYVSQRAIADIRRSIVQSLQMKSFSFYDQTQTGQLVARLTGDVEAISRLYFFFLTAFVRPVATALISLYFLSSVDIRLTGLTAIAIPLVLGVNYLYRLRVQPQWQRVRETWGRLNQHIQEFLVGIKVVRVFNREDYELNRFSKVDREYHDSNIAVVKTQASYYPLSSLALGLVTSLIFWYGGGEAIRGFLTVGSLLVYSRYLSMFLQPFQMVSFFISSYTRSMAGATRVFGIIDAEPQIKNGPVSVQLDYVKGDIEFQHVYFAYQDARNVLEDIDFSVKAGETVAILGPTGSGKTTLIYLIPRFYDPTSGKITLDGQDIRDIKLESVRRNIGIVLQDVFLFASTIRDNIAFGKPEAAMEEIVQASKAAQAHEFITALPQGYETMIGERGVTLSGGQRQRIAIARTILVDPKVLIFDDSTSFVDAETEAAIQKALDKLLENRTTFIITHRLSTIRKANRIVVLNKGRVAEIGTHEQLIEAKGVYAEIYLTQFTSAETMTERQ